MPGEVLVKFSANASPAERSALRASVADRVLHRYDRFGIEHWKLRSPSVDAAVELYRDHPAFTYVEPNYIVELQAVPNDPIYNQSRFNLISAPAAWDITTGDPNLLIGIIDTMVDFGHPDLAVNMWTNPGETPCDGVDNDGNGYVDDYFGYDAYYGRGIPYRDGLGACLPFSPSAAHHGTWVAGAAAAVTNNAVGVAGVAWRAKMATIAVADSGGSYSSNFAALVGGINYSIAIGCRITNNSYGFRVCSPMLQDVIESAGLSGQLYVAAAGNSGVDVDTSPADGMKILWPAAFTSPQTIVVGGSIGSIPSWNIGRRSVDLFAPGNSVSTTAPGGQYASVQETSIATPQVTGALALLLSRSPTISVADAKARLIASRDSITQMTGKCVSNGRLNIYKLLTQSAATPDASAPSAVGDLQVAFGSNATVATWSAPGDDGSAGSAASYEIRYSTTLITVNNFAYAARACWSPPLFPQVGGSTECLELAPLTCGFTYYFALRSWDDMGNVSGMSNVAWGYRNCSAGYYACGDGANSMPLEASVGDPVSTVASADAWTAAFELSVPPGRLGEPLEVAVFDLMGRRVQTLYRGAADKGRVEVSWAFSSGGRTRVSQGVYQVRFVLGADRWTRPVVVLR